MSAPLSRTELIGLGALLVLVLAVYAPGLGNQPLYDDAYLTQGSLLSEYSRLFPLRPRLLSYGSFVWVHALFGDSWWIQRLVNVLIHFGTVAALWALYREILRHIDAPPEPYGVAVAPHYEDSPALVVAVGFFALNPVAVYAVAYLIQRSIVLATFFVVMGLWLFARGLREKKPRLHALAAVCYVLAVMSKEHAILAPLAAVPIYIVVARPGWKRLAILAVAGAAAMAAAASVLWFRYGYILGRAFDEYSFVYLAQLSKLDPNAEKHAFGLSVVNEAWLFIQYGLRWIFPWEGWLSINLRPPFPLHFTNFPQALGIAGYAAALIGGFYLVLRYRHWPALIGVSILMPALLYPTEFSTVWVQDPFVLYRSYLWAIGIPGLVFFALHGPSPRVVALVGIVLAALLGAQSLERIFSMGTPERAWTDAIAKFPNDPRSVGRWFAYLNRGNAYADQNEMSLALNDFRKSDALGDLGMGAMNVGALLSAAGKHDEALAAFDRAEKQGYSLYNLSFQRGLALAALGRNAEAFRQFEITRSLKPPSPTRELMLLQIGRVGLQLQKRDEAIAALKELVAIEPDNREAAYMLSMGYVMSQDYEHARELLDALVKNEPTRQAYYARALANYGLKRKAEALSDIDNAIRLGPEDPHLREWQARIKALS